MITNWGYEVNTLGDMLTPEEFTAMTAGRYSGDVRIQPMLDAAAAAVRAYCGWHVGPSAECTMTTRAHDKRLTYTGSDTLIQLPARFVSAVNKVTVGGREVTDYSFETNGLLRIYDTCVDSRKTIIKVEYTAGSESAGVKSLIANMVTHGVAQSPGIQSEAAGGVSVTYSASWLNSAGASALPDANREILAPYRLQGVF